MEFNRIQQALAALETQCPYTDAREIEAWARAITQMRGLLAQMEAAENDAQLRDGDDGALN